MSSDATPQRFQRPLSDADVYEVLTVSFYGDILPVGVKTDASVRDSSHERSWVVVSSIWEEKFKNEHIRSKSSSITHPFADSDWWDMEIYEKPHRKRNSFLDSWAAKLTARSFFFAFSVVSNIFKGRVGESEMYDEDADKKRCNERELEGLVWAADFILTWISIFFQDKLETPCSIYAVECIRNFLHGHRSSWTALVRIFNYIYAMFSASLICSFVNA